MIYTMANPDPRRPAHSRVTRFGPGDFVASIRVDASSWISIGTFPTRKEAKEAVRRDDRYTVEK